MTVCAVVLVALVAAVVMSLLTTPMYQAATRLFVSTTAGASASDLYQGNRLSQDRVLSYTELLMGETLAQRTIDKLGLETNAGALRANIKATAKPDTVLIDVNVLDESPVRARDIANALSDEFVVMVRELETPKPGATPDARVVVEQRASIPTKPVIPKTARNLAAALVLGLVVGAGLAILRDRLDNTIKTQQALEEISSAGVVGHIPLDKDLRKLATISFDTHNSGAAEAFRKLRTNLQYLEVDNPPRLIVITSSSPSEGKSTTAINLALALAEAEHDVVLIDGDMRRPRLAKYLDLIESVGFSTVLSGAAGISEVLQETQFRRLSVLTAGPIPPNPSELLSSMAAKRLLSELREKFDYVIVDSSPLLAVTDGAVLAANADGTLVVARFGKTKREQLTHAIKSLNDVGASVLGSVLTMMPLRGSESYSYSYYGYGDDRPKQAEDSPPSANGDSAEPETDATIEVTESTGARRESSD